jgi:hypothetical protein
VPLRGGETKEAMVDSLRGDCWDRNRNSSMMKVDEKVLEHGSYTPDRGGLDMLREAAVGTG